MMGGEDGADVWTIYEELWLRGPRWDIFKAIFVEKKAAEMFLSTVFFLSVNEAAARRSYVPIHAGAAKTVTTPTCLSCS